MNTMTLRPTSSALVPRPAVPAVAWAVGFAVVNVWVQVAAIGADSELADHLLGLALLNLAAIVLKLVGAGLAVLADRELPASWRGPLTAGLAGAVSLLAGWGLAGAVAIALSPGGLFTSMTLAGGLLTVPGWLYPSFFVLGGLAFAWPARRSASRTSSPRRWVVGGAIAVPVLVLGVLFGVSWLLSTTGLLPTT